MCERRLTGQGLPLAVVPTYGLTESVSRERQLPPYDCKVGRADRVAKKAL